MVLICRWGDKGPRLFIAGGIQGQGADLPKIAIYQEVPCRIAIYQEGVIPSHRPLHSTVIL
jgi:hypothetical protein